MLSTLLQEIDFKDRRTALASKNQFKVQFLNQELSNLSVKPEFLDYFSQIFPTGDIEQTFEDIVHTLNFSLPVQLLLALSLALSSNVRISGVGIQILKHKLMDYYNLGRP
mmetsp:Transcript_25499/g.4235  ORF Transcript_25499/g.4235 Transcript_25499/m.4235 type:complete len:110 (+) Transcript_25499:172-501(+)